MAELRSKIDAPTGFEPGEQPEARRWPDARRWFDAGRWTTVFRYYQAGIVNALFGYGLFALLVRLGLNLYGAQVVAHLLGMTFNYVTYRRHVFRDAAPAKLRFALVYGVNYLVSVATLALAASLVASPYLAGLISIVSTSLINYFALKHLVFMPKIEA